MNNSKKNIHIIKQLLQEQALNNSVKTHITDTNIVIAMNSHADIRKAAS